MSVNQTPRLPEIAPATVTRRQPVMGIMKSRSSNHGRRPWVRGLNWLAALAIVAGASIATNSPAHAATVFDDEFNATSLDTNAWVAVNRPGDTSNAEQQCYKPDNASVTGGNLVILTKVDSSCAGYSYTSAMVQWKSFNFLYGYVEVRAKLAGGTGPWPAIWMLGWNCQQSNVTDPNICPWPQPGSDEVDIAEILGSNHNNVNRQIFSSNGNASCTPAFVSDVSQNWHTYGLTWSAGKVVWTVDGASSCTITGASVPSNPMFLMINTAIGGFGGGTINAATLPQSSFIDYVRVTQGTAPAAPTVSSVAPSSGPAAGGTSVTITGTNFTGASGVTFGAIAATTFTVNSATQITATSPAGTGTVDVTVTTPGGISAIGTADHFTYATALVPTVNMLAPTTGPAAGGTSVVITGTNLTGATAVKFGTAAATGLTGNTATQITVTSPAGTGTVDVTVTTASGTSAVNAVDKFTYTGPPPTVTMLAPTTGPAAGGTSVVITGTNLTGATAVKFGTAAATGLTGNTATQITVTSPAGLAIVDVTVTTPSGTSAVSATADKFTYIPAPTVVSLAPNNGPTVGGTSVVITGTNFTSATAVKFGTTAATALTVNSATQITATSPAGTGTVDVTVTAPGGTSAMTAADRFAYTLPPAAYTAVTPIRLLDTRTTGGPLGAGAVRNLSVAGVTPGAPAGASAVVLNVTATNTTAASYLTVYPAGSVRPLASSLNWVAGKTIPNLVTVQVGTGGAISLFNGFGSTDVVVDLEGYFTAPSGTAGGEAALTPARITDTRAGSGQPNAGSTLGPTSTITVQVTGAGGVPATGVSAAILNVTVTNTTTASFLTIWPAGATRPTASNLNWTAGVTIPNRVIVPISASGQVSVYNQFGSADVIVDVSGYFTDASASGKFFTPVSPQRIADTRSALGCPTTLGALGTCTLSITGLSGVPSGASAVVLNVTVTNNTAPSFLTVYPSTGAQPSSSDLNWIGGQTIPNMVVATLGTSGAITFYNSAGSTAVVVDIAGWFS
jgi:beta-glucanase (GH16 family)